LCHTIYTTATFIFRGDMTAKRTFIHFQTTPDNKEEFLAHCKERGRDGSSVLRELAEAYVEGRVTITMSEAQKKQAQQNEEMYK
jgi:hypothetical protein